MRKPTALLPLAAVLAAISVAAHAEAPPGDRHGGPPPGGPRHGGLFLSPAGEPFRDGDGLDAWFAGADADHDGALTLAEFRADAMRFFKVLDANHDGVVDGTENQVYETRIAPEITGMGPEDREDGPRSGGMGGGPGGGMDRGGMGRGGMGGGGMGGPGGGHGGGPPDGDGDRGKPSGARNFSRLEGAARYSLINEPQPVRGADINLDWKVTAEEWAKAAGRRFALLDADGDGKLTLATLPPPGGRAAHGPRRKGLFGGRRPDQ